MPTLKTELDDPAGFDLVVIGAGGAGLSAAVYAGIAGARVLVVESTAHVGGTTAWSAGTTWIPGTELAAQVNRDDTLEAAARFLDHAVGSHAPAALRRLARVNVTRVGTDLLLHGVY